MRGVGRIAHKAGELMELVGGQLYGRPSDPVLEGMLKVAGPAVTLSIRPLPVGGCIRFKPG